MAATKLALECPYCNWIFKAAPPDEMHSAYSFEKPLRGSFHGEVIEQNLTCGNPKCQRSLTIYWFAPLDYFNRV